MMRLIPFLAALLIPSWASATRTNLACSGMTDEGCWDADYVDEVGTTPGIPVAYQTFVAANPNIAVAMSYSSLDKAIREAIWNNIIEAEVTNGGAGVNTLPAPANMGDPNQTTPPFVYSVWLDQTEAFESFGSKVAHALWLEFSGNVPWTIAGLTLAEYRLLFDPAYQWEREATPAPPDTAVWQPSDASHTGLFYRFIHHSPMDLYTVSMTALGGAPFAGTQSEAWELLLTLGNDFRHYTSGDPVSIVTINEAMVDKISRSGCHSASQMMMGLLRSINIPADTIKGWLEGTAHASNYIPSLDLFLAHGDNIYSAGEIWPYRKVSWEWTWAQANLTPGDSGNSAKNTWRYQYTFSMWLALRGYYDNSYCAGTFIEASFPDPTLLAAVQNELARRRPDCAP